MPKPNQKSNIPGKQKVKVASFADVMQQVQGVRYLVPDWVPSGMLTMVIAEPGIGKSAFALYGLVKPIITGGRWFNNKKVTGDPGYALWCDTEGTAAINVTRIKGWGLPADRIIVPFADDPLRPLNLNCSEDLLRIEQVINDFKIRLAVIDSLRGSHSGDENNSRVAEVLQNLTGIAERTGAAIVVIHHTKKLYVDEEMTANSSRGSNAIFAMVRSMLGINKPDAQSEWCRLQMLKENIGMKPKPIGFLVGSNGLQFGDAPEKPRKNSQKIKAEDWLLENMQPGEWCSAKELQSAAMSVGLSETALRRARDTLGIIKPDNVRKSKHRWQWRMPLKGDSKTAPKKATP